MYCVPQKLSQICTVFYVSVLGRLRDLQDIFALIYGTPVKKTPKITLHFNIGTLRIFGYHLCKGANLVAERARVREKGQVVRDNLRLNMPRPITREI